MENNIPITNHSNKAVKRIYWLDTIRCLAFIMVIYSHIDFCNQQIMKFFSPVFLSTFFFISGYLSKSRIKFRLYLEQRTRTLYIPFLFWGLLLICRKHIFSFKENVLPWGEGLKSFILQDGTDNFIWFIPALYAFSIIFYWFERFSKNDLHLFVSLAIFTMINWIYLYGCNGPKLPYHLETAGFACLLMGLGKIYQRNEMVCLKYFKTKYLLTALVLYFAVYCVCPKVSYGGSLYMYNWIIAVSTGLYLMIFISKLEIMKNKLFLYLGANTLICFIFHGQIYTILEVLIKKSSLMTLLYNSKLLFTMTGILETCLVTILLIIPIWFINRYLKFTIGKGYKLWK